MIRSIQEQIGISRLGIPLCRRLILDLEQLA